MKMRNIFRYKKKTPSDGSCLYCVPTEAALDKSDSKYASVHVYSSRKDKNGNLDAVDYLASVLASSLKVSDPSDSPEGWEVVTSQNVDTEELKKMGLGVDIQEDADGNWEATVTKGKEVIAAWREPKVNLDPMTDPRPDFVFLDPRKTEPKPDPEPPMNDARIFELLAQVESNSGHAGILFHRECILLQPRSKEKGYTVWYALEPCTDSKGIISYEFNDHVYVDDTDVVSTGPAYVTAMRLVYKGVPYNFKLRHESACGHTLAGQVFLQHRESGQWAKSYSAQSDPCPLYSSSGKRTMVERAMVRRDYVAYTLEELILHLPSGTNVEMKAWESGYVYVAIEPSFEGTEGCTPDFFCGSLSPFEASRVLSILWSGQRERQQVKVRSKKGGILGEVIHPTLLGINSPGHAVLRCTEPNSEGMIVSVTHILTPRNTLLEDWEVLYPEDYEHYVSSVLDTPVRPGSVWVHKTTNQVYVAMKVLEGDVPTLRLQSGTVTTLVPVHALRDDYRPLSIADRTDQKISEAIEWVDCNESFFSYNLKRKEHSGGPYNVLHKTPSECFLGALFGKLLPKKGEEGADAPRTPTFHFMRGPDVIFTLIGGEPGSDSVVYLASSVPDGKTDQCVIFNGYVPSLKEVPGYERQTLSGHEATHNLVSAYGFSQELKGEGFDLSIEWSFPSPSTLSVSLVSRNNDEEGSRTLLYTNVISRDTSGDGHESKPSQAMVEKSNDLAPSESSAAAYAIAASQMGKMIQGPLVDFLVSKGLPVDQEKLKSFLGSSHGKILVAALAGLTMEKSEHPVAQRLAKELRVQALAQLGILISDEFLAPFLEMATSSLRGVTLPPPAPMSFPTAKEEIKVRVKGETENV